MASARENRAPHKVVVGTVVSGYGLFSLPLEQRLDRMDRIVAAMSAQAAAQYPEHPLDLAILPETFLTNPGDSPAKQALTLDAIQPRIAACAKRAHAYLVIPALLRESTPSPRLSNTAILVGRAVGADGDKLAAQVDQRLQQVKTRAAGATTKPRVARAHRPRIGCEQPARHADQRALACAVLAHERVHAAGRHGERHVVERRSTRESLRDALEP